MRNFREYEVWKKAISFTKKIYILTNDFPANEKYGIISQIQRASVSISSNIAEGCSRFSEKDFARFIEISLGSSYETENLIIISLELNFINEHKYNELIQEIQIIQKQLSALYSILTKSK